MIFAPLPTHNKRRVHVDVQIGGVPRFWHGRIVPHQPPCALSASSDNVPPLVLAADKKFPKTA